MPDEIGADEKIGNEARFLDDPDFQLQTVNDRLNRGGNGGVVDVVGADVRRL